MYAVPVSHRTAAAFAGALTFAFLYGVTAAVLVSLLIAVVTGSDLTVGVPFWAVLTGTTVTGAVYGWRHP